MRSLFLKIFLSFWLALALSVVLAILVTLAMRPQRDSATWEALRAKALTEAVQAYEQGGEPVVREYLEDLEQSHHVRAFLFDEQGNELSQRPAPPWAERIARGRAMRRSPGFWAKWMPERFMRQSTTGASGRQFTLVIELPPGPRLFFGPHGVPGLGLLIAIVSSGVVSYVLARYLTAPVVRLRTATQQLAAGDLTARAEAPPKRRRDEIAELVRDFNGMAARLEDLVNAQNRLLNDVSHELRSPLARLNVALGLARQRTGPEAQGALERIEREAERLNELIGRLLAIARLESGEEAMQRSAVNLGGMLHEICKDADFEAQSRNCRVKCVIADACVVMGHAGLLHSAMENVVRNATRYTREGTEVEIRLEKAQDAKGPEAVVRVADSGPGVPEEALHKLFRPFYRLDDARNRQTGGVGLGLAITERTVRLHGGRVKAANRPEGGLIVEIRLPLAPRAATESSVEKMSVPAEG
ncbi:MAG: two-component sensor histidine kinase [Acidobacteria bacterium]|nr:MAG: two-component sensor histidine kinase [Acidobacteriota bacterium]